MTLTESQKHLTSLIEADTPYPHKDDLFNLDDMPMELLDAAWHRYHPYTMTKNHRNKLSSIRKIAESKTDYKQQIEDTQKAITETYKIPVEHFLIVNGEHGLYAAILVALTDDNVDIIEKEMESQGFFRAQPTDNQILEDRKNRKWIDIRFEPTEPDDVTFEIKTKYNVLFHLVPSVFSRKVETEGIKTSNRNPLFRYSEDRAFLIEGDATMEEIQELVNSLYAQAIMKGYKNLTRRIKHTQRWLNHFQHIHYLHFHVSFSETTTTPLSPYHVEVSSVHRHRCQVVLRASHVTRLRSLCFLC